MGYGRAAIPQIETAIHTSAPPGRLHLIAALDKIGDGDAVPVLRHVAVFDITAEVRVAAERLLSRWASSAGDRPRAARAQAALAEIGRKRAAGIGPLQFGDGGMPGVPSTVGRARSRSARKRNPDHGPPRATARARAPAKPPVVTRTDGGTYIRAQSKHKELQSGDNCASTLAPCHFPVWSSGLTWRS